MHAEPPKRRGRPPSGSRGAILAAALELLRERGIARLTTREVATRAGVSEASIFYHYGDRAGLLEAVFEAGVMPMRAFAENRLAGSDPRAVLGAFARALEQFLDEVLPVIAAAHADPDLRDALAAYMTHEDLGPHRGVDVVGEYVAARQGAGGARADVDPHAVALMLVGACYIRSTQRQMPLYKVSLPAIEDVIDALVAMLAAEA
jgi:AcrR family transcriptional regulator